MAITTLTGALAGMQPMWYFNKQTPTGTTVIGRPMSYWLSNGFPSAGTVSSTINGATYSSSSALVTGQIPHFDPASGNAYLSRLQAQSSVATLLLLCDRLWDNGYFYSDPNGGHSAINSFDEYSFNLGAPVAGPGNLSNGTYSSGGITAWSLGVWRRDFANGIALVNPKGNGAKTVVVDAANPVWHLRGTQAPTINNAAQIPAGGTVTLADSDGLILSRTAT